MQFNFDVQFIISAQFLPNFPFVPLHSLHHAKTFLFSHIFIFFGKVRQQIHGQKKWGTVMDKILPW